MLTNLQVDRLHKSRLRYAGLNSDPSAVQHARSELIKRFINHVRQSAGIEILASEVGLSQIDGNAPNGMNFTGFTLEAYAHLDSVVARLSHDQVYPVPAASYGDSSLRRELYDRLLSIEGEYASDLHNIISEFSGLLPEGQVLKVAAAIALAKSKRREARAMADMSQVVLQSTYGYVERTIDPSVRHPDPGPVPSSGYAQAMHMAVKEQERARAEAELLRMLETQAWEESVLRPAVGKIAAELFTQPVQVTIPADFTAKILPGQPLK